MFFAGGFTLLREQLETWAVANPTSASGAA